MLTLPIDAHSQRVSIYGGGEHLWSPDRHDARNRPGGTDRPTVESRTDPEGVARVNRSGRVWGTWRCHGASGPRPGAERHELVNSASTNPRNDARRLEADSQSGWTGRLTAILTDEASS